MEMKQKKKEAKSLLGVLVNGNSGKITKHKGKTGFQVGDWQGS